MTFSVYQHWDPLKVALVGKSYPPQIYDFIKNEKVRKVFYRIAEETEEDYQKLITLLEKFNVEIYRTDIEYLCDLAKTNIKLQKPLPSPMYAMQPRDFSIMLGETFYVRDTLQYLIFELIDKCKLEGNKIIKSFQTGIDKPDWLSYIDGSMTSRIGKDLVIGTHNKENFEEEKIEIIQKIIQNHLPNYRIKVANTEGHLDGTFCPVVPGLIISGFDLVNYEKTFPNWEVVTIKGESYDKIPEWLTLKEKNKGKWLVLGEETNDDFTNFLETWLNHWVGYIEESVFDLNMLVIDKKNAIVNSYNKIVFDAFENYGITPHICNFRHRYFWDGGLHCITSDIHRKGVLEDYKLHITN